METEGLDSSPASQSACLVRALLANFRSAIDLKHIDLVHAKAYFMDVAAAASEAEAANPAGERLHVDQLYLIMIKVIEDYQERHAFSREPRPEEYYDKRALTIQSHTGFAHWLKRAEVEGIEPDPSASEVKLLCKTMEQAAKRLPDAAIGRPSKVLWLTPLDGEVAQHVNSAAINQTLNLNPDHTANRLRELLGLIRRKPGEHAIAFIIREPLGAYAEPGLFAPTIFEARGYERYRHWPTSRAAQHSAGRSYDLNRSARKKALDGMHGAPEIVCAPLALSELGNVIYLGRITAGDDLESDPITGDLRERLEDDREFANEISGGEPSSAIIVWIAQELGL